MHFVTAALRCSLHQPRHMNARLNGMVSGDQAYITATNDKEVLTRLHQVPIDQGLKSASAINTRKCIAREG